MPNPIQSTAEGPQAAVRKYSAFISYRHADNKEAGRHWATWLHQFLETYEIPRTLLNSRNARGEPLPTTLYPVFRDEEELPADADLSNNIKAALQNSRCLIVICSPRAVASRFVSEEIRYFKELGKAEQILAVIIAGEPNASDDPSKQAAGNDAALECFPEPLRFGVTGGDGRVDWNRRTEPIAADLRVGGRPEEGFTTTAEYARSLRARSVKDVKTRTLEYSERLKLAQLKIVSGLLGVPLGTLTERHKASEEAKRQKRRLTYGVIGVLTMLALVLVGYGLISRSRIKTLGEAANSGGLVLTPKVPPDFYHNAKLLGERGEFEKAAAAYQMLFAKGGHYLDVLDSLRHLARASRGRISAERVTEIIHPCGTQFELCLRLLEGKTNAAAAAESLAGAAPTAKSSAALLLTVQRVLQQDITLGNTYSGRAWLHNLQALIDEQSSASIQGCYLNPLSVPRAAPGFTVGATEERSAHGESGSAHSNALQPEPAAIASAESNAATSGVVPRVFFDGQKWKLGFGWDEQFSPPSMAYPPEYIVSSPDLDGLAFGTNLFATWRGSKPKDIGEQMDMALLISDHAGIVLHKRSLEPAPVTSPNARLAGGKVGRLPPPGSLASIPPSAFRLRVIFKEATGVKVTSCFRVFVLEALLADPARLVNPNRLKWEYSPISSAAYDAAAPVKSAPGQTIEATAYLTVDNRPERFDMCELEIREVADHVGDPPEFRKFTIFVAELPEWRDGVDVLDLTDITRLVGQECPVSRFAITGDGRHVGEEHREEMLKKERMRMDGHDVQVAIRFHYCRFYRNGLHLKVEACTSDNVRSSTCFEVPPRTNNFTDHIGLIPVAPETFAKALKAASSGSPSLEDHRPFELDESGKTGDPFRVVARFSPECQSSDVTFRAVNATVLTNEIASASESTLWVKPEEGALKHRPSLGKSPYLIGEWKEEAGKVRRAVWRIEESDGGYWLKCIKTLEEELQWAAEQTGQL